MQYAVLRWISPWLIVAVAAAWGPAAWPARAAAQEDGAVEQAKALSRAFRGAAKKVLPTVVTVRTTTKPRGMEGGLRGENPFQGTPFEDFFDGDNGPGFRHPPIYPRDSGVGSGVIIDPKGIVLTNNHVVEDADEVVVELADGRKLKATDIKVDKDTDLAVMRIKPEEDLPAARLGDSDKLEIGDWVIAVGNPFELELTVSAGIISGKGRTLGQIKRAKFLQTDAAINPGNSGGPLVNLDGEVVGINTAIASSSGGYQGIGFAIPINLAKWVTRQLIERGSVQRSYLGVSIAPITGDLAQKLGVRPHAGVLVSEVFPNSPAAKAGFQEGDVVLAFAGRPVGTPRELQELVEQTPPGAKQEVAILRDGKRESLAVVVSPLPGDFGVASAPAGRPRSADQRLSTTSYDDRQLGLEVDELTDALASRLGYQGSSGVLITDVDDRGIAAEAGILPGMLVLRVGKTPVKNVAQFRDALKSQSLKEGILLLLRTREGNRFVVLQRSP